MWDPALSTSAAVCNEPATWSASESSCSATFSMHSVPVGVGTGGHSWENGENTFPHFSDFAQAGLRDVLTGQVVKTTTAFHFEPQEKKKHFELQEKAANWNQTDLPQFSENWKFTLRTYMFCWTNKISFGRGEKGGPDICFGQEF